ncbi:MAG TPA: glycosyltransferase family 4 protein, partial [Candidatus Faecousia faecipullorum]|nr:glycosyltransferase family 4 protein [Candidatus Faecousia faecipullorum]
PNSLGEAMLLGVPSVASDVGGVADMMDHGKEGYICQPTAPYMLAHHICRIFRMEEDAENLGSAARAHAQKTHDPEKNLAALLHIYEEVIGEAGRN